MVRLLRLLVPLLTASCAFGAPPMLVYLGTYTQTTSRGIYVMRFDPDNGSLSQPELAAEGRNPTFVAIDPSRKHLYASGELKLDPQPAAAVGGIAAYSIDPASGMLTFLNQQATGGGGTTHLVLDATGRMIVAVNYGVGYVCALPILADGRVGEPAAHLTQTGPLGPNKDRQKQAHPHSATLSHDNRFAYVCDLGLDRVFIYRIDPATSGLVPNDPPFASTPPGAGPRHSVFSADGRSFYTIDEMGGTVCAFACDPATGALTFKQSITTLPPDFTGFDNSAEIRIHPNDRFIYASNRDVSGKGQDSIAVFARDPSTGLLSTVQIISCGGRHPRNFDLSPDGRWLLCANRDTDNIVEFSVDGTTGRLKRTGREVKVGQPVCVVFCP